MIFFLAAAHRSDDSGHPQGGSGVRASRRLPTACGYRGARCLPFTPSASLEVSPGMSPSLRRCRALGAPRGRRRLLWPRFQCVQRGCGCLKPFWGKGGFCLFFAFLFGRGKPLSAASGMWWPDTVRDAFPRAGSEAGVTMCLQPWSNPPAEFFGFWGSVPQHPIAPG